MSSGEDYDMETSMFYPMNYNILLNTFVIFQWMTCAFFSTWGYLAYNDGGEMMNACFTVGLEGGNAEFFEAA